MVKNKQIQNWTKEELIKKLKQRNFQYGELSNKYASLKYELETKIKRQGLIITLNQLYNLEEELINSFDDGSNCFSSDDNKKFQINIINKTPKCSDTWMTEKQSNG